MSTLARRGNMKEVNGTNRLNTYDTVDAHAQKDKENKLAI